MALDQTLYTAWLYERTSNASGSDTGSWNAQQGIKPASERGLDDTERITIGPVDSTYYVDWILNYRGPVLIPANSKFFVSVRGRSMDIYTSSLSPKIIIDGTTEITTASRIGNWDSGVDATKTLAFTSGAADLTAYSSLVLRLTQVSGVTRGGTGFYPFHDDTFCGFDDTGSGGIAPLAVVFELVEPVQGTHASPTILTSHLPTFRVKARYVYVWNTITLTKSTDTLSTAAHSASAPTEQTVGVASDYTTSTPEDTNSARILEFTADATRKADTLTNTYYEIKVKQGATVRGTLALETLLDVQRPVLTTLNGSAAGSYVMTTEPTPVVVWNDPNATADRWQVRVYNTSDVLQHDSGETVSDANQYALPNSLSNLTTLYVVVTVAKGTDWTVNSARGYFQVDNTSTALQITSHAGTLDTPEVIVTQAPTVSWAFTKTQAAYNVVARNASTGAVTYETGWTASATESKALPAATLSLGVTYSIQVQVKDNLGNVYSTDEQVYLHVNESSISAPALTGEPNTDTKTDVTLVWSAPAVNDSDTLTYELELTRPAAQVETYSVGTALSFVLGRLGAGTYSWRVRATDEHSLAGSWAAADSFDVSLLGATPTVTLHPLPSSVTTTPHSTWSYEDLDGDAQTDYQIVTASDAGFTTGVVDSGTVTSTNQYHNHAALAAGTWYRKVRVRTASTDWSDYDSDSIVIVAPTSQSSDLQLYRDDGATEITTPISNLTITRALDSPCSFRFSIDNFAYDERSIADDDDLVLKIKDSAGKLLEFRGQVTHKNVGDLLEVEAKDISRKFDRMKVTRRLGRSTTGEIVKAIVENPTGNKATGITAHVEEIPDPDSAGLPIRFDEFIGSGKSVQQWLSDFQAASGFRWYVESVSGVWHFHWFNPDNCPAYSVTLKDNIDYAAESATQWRVLEDTAVEKSLEGYANRVRYWAASTPPSLPEGYASFDELLTEATTDWTAYSGTTLTQEAVEKVTGTYAIEFASTQLSNEQIPSFVNLGYRKVPQPYRDMRGLEFGALLCRAKLVVDRTGGAETWGDVKPYLNLRVFSASDVGPAATVAGVSVSLPLTDGQWVDLRYDILADLYKYLGANAGDVNALGWRLDFHFGPLPPVGVAQTWRAWVYIDDMAIQGKPPPSPQGFERYVETAAVTAGTEDPLEIPLSESNLPMAAIQALAKGLLNERSRTQTHIGNLTLAGMRNIPMQTKVPLVLSRRNINATYPLYSVEWKPLDTGHVTVCGFGDAPQGGGGAEELASALRLIKHRLSALDAERQ